MKPKNDCSLKFHSFISSSSSINIKNIFSFSSTLNVGFFGFHAFFLQLINSPKTFNRRVEALHTVFVFAIFQCANVPPQSKLSSKFFWDSQVNSEHNSIDNRHEFDRAEDFYFKLIIFNALSKSSVCIKIALWNNLQLKQVKMLK